MIIGPASPGPSLFEPLGRRAGGVFHILRPCPAGVHVPGSHRLGRTALRGAPGRAVLRGRDLRPQAGYGPGNLPGPPGAGTVRILGAPGGCPGLRAIRRRIVRDPHPDRSRGHPRPAACHAPGRLHPHGSTETGADPVLAGAAARPPVSIGSPELPST
ncbi:MAG: hypothetical protein M0C28_30075 [Candidatus Moduliflexus flocculans]|nr:hypothetical protein [Candidatus Moduliflexus flocculans]